VDNFSFASSSIFLVVAFLIRSLDISDIVSYSALNASEFSSIFSTS
jgi:hypothetical protein